MGTITILEETTKNPITLIGKRAGVCYGTDITDDEKNYKRGLDCIKSGHGRTLEFVNVEMIIDGYSARCIREYYTHIGGMPTRLQSSTRYINYKNFDYVVPYSIFTDDDCFQIYVDTINTIQQACEKLEKESMPLEDIAMLLPLGMKTKVVDKRNVRNLIDMSRVRECSRAYWEFNEMFFDIKNALGEYSEEWKWLVDHMFHAKCEEYGYCTEKKSCGRYPREEVYDA